MRVNNAAITAFGAFEGIPVDAFRGVIETNLMGYVNGMRTAMPYMREQGSGGACFKRRETAVVLFIATTLPQFFLVGVSWPAEAILPALRAVGRVFPTKSAISGLIRINQMGARLMEVAGNWTMLWILTGIYFSLAVLTSRFGARPEIVHA